MNLCCSTPPTLAETTVRGRGGHGCWAASMPGAGASTHLPGQRGASDRPERRIPGGAGDGGRLPAAPHRMRRLG